MVCLDSDIIIDVLRNEKKIVEKIMRLRETILLTTTSINTFELFKGSFYTRDEEEKSGIMKFLIGIKLLSFNFKASKKAAEIFEILRNKGKSMELADIMIASIAITNNESLLTKNTRHFSKIPELKLESF